MMILNQVEEETLDIIIRNIEKDTYIATSSYDIFPNYIHSQIKRLLSTLERYGYLASSDCWLNGWTATITPIGISYFEKKGLRKELFEELPENAKKLLKELLECELKNDNIAEALREELEKDKTDTITRSIIGTLKYNGLLKVNWADNTVYYAELTNEGRTYFEREKKYMEQLEKMSKPSVHIESLTNSGVFSMGDIIDSNITIDNSIEQLEKEVDEKGNEDKEELLEILQEVKDYIDNIKETKSISKNTGLFKRIGKHIEKHQWFYTQIIGLLGQVMLSGMGNQI